MMWLIIYTYICISISLTSIFTIYIPLRKRLHIDGYTYSWWNLPLYLLGMTALAPITLPAVLRGVTEELVDKVKESIDKNNS